MGRDGNTTSVAPTSSAAGTTSFTIRQTSFGSYTFSSLYHNMRTRGAPLYLKFLVSGIRRTCVRSQPPLSAPSAYVRPLFTFSVSLGFSLRVRRQSAWYLPGEDSTAMVGISPILVAVDGCTASRSAQSHSVGRTCSIFRPFSRNLATE